MYRKIFKAESKKDLLVKLPEEYLNKQVEVIAFQVRDESAEASDKGQYGRSNEIF